MQGPFESHPHYGGERDENKHSHGKRKYRYENSSLFISLEKIGFSLEIKHSKPCSVGGQSLCAHYALVRGGDVMNLSGNTGEGREWIIICDLDGTIIDSETTNYRNLMGVLREFGYWKYRNVILKGIEEGEDIETIMKRLNITEETRKQMEGRMKTLLQEVPVTLLQGAKEKIQHLDHRGFVFCLATDNYRKVTTHVMKNHGLQDVFRSEHIITVDTFPERKPSQKIVEELLKRTNRKKAIILGNTIREISLAKNSGCSAVIIQGKNDIRNHMEEENRILKNLPILENCNENIYYVKNWEEVSEIILHLVYQCSRRAG